MKKIISVLMCMSIAVSLSACCSKQNKGTKASQAIDIISPDTIITAETASTAAAVSLSMDSDDVVNDGMARTVTYVPAELGAGDPVSISIEQFSDSMPVSQVWNDYENNRVRRNASDLIQGIGQDCYIAYPYICVFVRGCYVKITAGSGDGQEQRELLVSLATQAATAIENIISEDAVNDAKGNVIK